MINKLRNLQLILLFLAAGFSIYIFSMPNPASAQVYGRTCCNDAGGGVPGWNCSGCSGIPWQTGAPYDVSCTDSSFCCSAPRPIGNTCCISDCDEPSICTPSNPTAALLVSPPNGSVGQESIITLSWAQNGSWGNKCPQPNQNLYRLYLKEKTTSNCLDPGGWWLAAQTTSVSTQVTVEWGKNYCWGVQKNNGQGSAMSQVWEFSTYNPSLVSNPTINAPKCGGVQISGRIDNPNSNNPIKVQFDIYDPNSDFSLGVNRFKEFHLGVIQSGTQNAQVVPYNVLQPQILQNSTALYRAEILSTSQGRFSTIVASGGSWPFGTGITAGNLDGLSQRTALLNINSTNGTTIQQINNQTLRVTWEIQFNTSFPSADLNFYLMAITATGNGTWISQDTSLDTNFNYKRFATWETDMINPSVDVGSPITTGSSTFEINWQASDINGITNALSQCSVTIGSLGLVDTTLGQALNLTPAVTDCLINTASLGNHSYSITSPNTEGGNAIFTLTAQDSACNSSTDSSNLNDPTSWIATSQGIVSASEGFTNMVIRNVNLENIVPLFGSDDSYLGMYSVISGNENLVNSRQSKFHYYTTNYNDLNVDASSFGNSSSWYDYLYNLVAGQVTLTTLSTTFIPQNSDLAGQLGVAENTRNFVLVSNNSNNDLTISSGFSCNANTVIFVPGQLTIEPSMSRTVSGGCLFITKGNILITSGANTPPLQTRPNGASSYDNVDGFFITDGQFITTADTPSNRPSEGLFIKGGVVASTVDLKRTLGVSNNNLQPSEVIYYDPYYIQIFRDVLSDRLYSIRAK